MKEGHGQRRLRIDGGCSCEPQRVLGSDAEGGEDARSSRRSDPHGGLFPRDQHPPRKHTTLFGIIWPVGRGQGHVAQWIALRATHTRMESLTLACGKTWRDSTRSWYH